MFLKNLLASLRGDTKIPESDPHLGPVRKIQNPTSLLSYPLEMVVVVATAVTEEMYPQALIFLPRWWASPTSPRRLASIQTATAICPELDVLARPRPPLESFLEDLTLSLALSRPE